MKVEQFVFGRVSSGLRRGAGGGYQVAAASQGLVDDASLCERLREISRYPDVNLTPPPVRYGLSPIGEEGVALWRCGFARDASGSVGYFAHHFFFPVGELRRAGVVPLLHAIGQPFFTSEADLPEDRLLPCLEWPAESVPALPPAGEKRDRILALATALLSPKQRTTSTWISGDLADDEILPGLAAATALLPPALANQQSWCVNFAGAIANLTCFRLVSCPRTELLPRPRDEFVPIPIPAVELPPYIASIAADKVDAGRVRQVSLAASDSGEMEAEERFSVLNDPANTEAIRALEDLAPGTFDASLSERPRDFLAYHFQLREWKLTWPVKIEQTNLVSWSDALLEFRGHAGVVRFLAETHLQLLGSDSGTLGKTSADWLARNAMLPAIVDDCRRLNLHQLHRVAERLEKQPGYDSFAHRSFAQNLLKNIASGGKPNTDFLRFLKVSPLFREDPAACLIELLTIMNDGGFPDPFPDLQGYDTELLSAFVNGFFRCFMPLDRKPTFDTDDLIALTGALPQDMAIEIIMRLLDGVNDCLAITAAEGGGFLDRPTRTRIIAILEKESHPARSRTSAARAWLNLNAASPKALLSEEQRAQLEAMATVSSFRSFLKKLTWGADRDP